jgi:hypothetical protein
MFAYNIKACPRGKLAFCLLPTKHPRSGRKANIKNQNFYTSPTKKTYFCALFNDSPN